jgi:hypothetical protein
MRLSPPKSTTKIKSENLDWPSDTFTDSTSFEKKRKQLGTRKINAVSRFSIGFAPMLCVISATEKTKNIRELKTN